MNNCWQRRSLPRRRTRKRPGARRQRPVRLRRGWRMSPHWVAPAGEKRRAMALGPETIREIERAEMARSIEIWANNENRRREQEAKEKKRTEFERVSTEQRVPLPKFRTGD